MLTFAVSGEESWNRSAKLAPIYGYFMGSHLPKLLFQLFSYKKMRSAKSSSVGIYPFTIIVVQMDTLKSRWLDHSSYILAIRKYISEVVLLSLMLIALQQNYKF